MNLISTTKLLIQKLRGDGRMPLLDAVKLFYEQHEIDILDMNSCYAKAQGRTRRQDGESPN